MAGLEGQGDRNVDRHGHSARELKFFSDFGIERQIINAPIGPGKHRRIPGEPVDRGIDRYRAPRIQRNADEVENRGSHFRGQRDEEHFVPVRVAPDRRVEPVGEGGGAGGHAECSITP